MFKKILIANRGEIACRVIKTARKMGIKTVAVYSDADADALHVEMADEAVHVGAPPAAESYLIIDRIVKACLDTGAEAVHPGYGFLSEKANFCAALEAHGIKFIGPNVRAIGAMGDKIESKKLAAAAGVNTVPGYLGVIKDTDEAVKIAQEIGYPVMIKASAGGGGKGMRIAWNEAETREGFQSATNEARSSFADDRVFIEKFVTSPRHIEIQVLGDKHGNVVYVNERECSIQRRNQKVIEEAPSPFLDEATRKAMGEQSVALAKEVDYDSAGTVEFIVDGERNFYFLEMNTRLQVEHPVTELITGIDLVEQMIRVAYGETLAIKQEDIGINGWAIESRVYAEDPTRGFLPSIGRLTHYDPPAEGPDGNGVIVRNDTGVFAGAEISMFYDPMIAKLCTHAPTREQAIDAQRAALDAFYIRGISHNISFVSAVLGHERFRSGRLTTGFIAEEFPDGFSGGTVDALALDNLTAAAIALHRRTQEREIRISGQLTNHGRKLQTEYVVQVGDDKRSVSVENAEGGYDVTFGGRLLAVRTDWVPGSKLLRGSVNGKPVIVQVEKKGEGFRLFHSGAEVVVSVRTPRAAQLAALMPVKLPPDTSKFLLCPMPGLIVSINVSEGEEVKAGQTLAVVEAMKMENVLKAERDGKVAKVKGKKGDSFAVDQVILEFE
ncbi:acetyl-CoA carboxylase biotin carboxylase subunit [Zavarzinia compransoris]|uniref:propionyl-CoA carboxylase n=1 Tax=Zavarzinia compransoris TaxID=1264899 RepID=A0A317DYE3_9PROT|nr:acetyl/propionyl/methylcrotonyl-CoA carboxylase subunit alpha [Zavarzinia compransoris]PWR18013.1 acetyl/propionyl-CoA carboxylase subunit alpha [Zavarzinia compransoris]TDP43522.1 biotin carboxyl carrier protein /biotin carboxylase [Zavarzinia compransoris]